MANVYFGNLRKAVSLPAPTSGLTATAFGRIEKIELANGGAFISQSQATHQEYDMSWGVTDETLLTPLYEFQRGLHGSGLLYYCDPYIDNPLPPHWAEPALSGKGWPSLAKAGLEPTLTPTGTTYTNLHTNPLPREATGWTVEAGTSGVATVAFSDAGWAEATWTTAATAGAPRIRVLMGQQGEVAAGEQITAAVDAWAEAGAGQWRIAIEWFTAANALISTSAGTNTTLGTTRNAANRLSLTATAPATATKFAVYVTRNGTTVPIGTKLAASRATVVKAAVALPYFDGSSVFMNGAEAVWVGVPDASYSTMTVPLAGMPALSATYTLTAPLAESVPPRAATLLVPPTQTLWIGFSGAASGGGGVYVRTVGVDGSISAPQLLTLLSPSGSTRLNTSFDGASVSAVLIYLDTVVTGAATVTLNSGSAVYAPTGTPPTLTGSHLPGEGHTGMRFQSAPVKTQVMKRGGKNFITAGISLTEIGAWL